MTNRSRILSLDYFVGGVPAGDIFKGSLDDLAEIIQLQGEEEYRLNTLAEVCLIGLVSYFEAFCKNQFASLINICPEVLNNFFEKRGDVSIKVKDLLTLDYKSKTKIGCLLSEQYDFGSANSINSLYHHLISITPFSKDEMKKYDALLNDRNLLVHHAGIYTMKYFQQRFIQKSVKDTVFQHSLVVKKKDFESWARFLEEIGVKICTSSYKALTKFIRDKRFKLSKESKVALEYLQWPKW